MNIQRHLLFALFAPLPFSALAGPEDPRLVETDKLWKEYSEARKALSEIPKPKLGEPEFSKKLSVWSEAYRSNCEAARKLLPPLVAMAADVPAEDYELMQVELRQIHRDLTSGPTQAGHDNRKYIAETIHPHVRDQALSAERGALFAELTTPDQLIRGGDQAARRGQLTEPLGWALQDTHALALARAGKFKEARNENDLLLKKVQILLEKGRLPKLEMNFRGHARAKKSLQREFLLHRALIEALAGNDEAAKARLAESTEIKEEDPAILDAQAALQKRINELAKP